jgi:hypothetical protein
VLSIWIGVVNGLPLLAEGDKISVTLDPIDVHGGLLPRQSLA